MEQPVTVKGTEPGGQAGWKGLEHPAATSGKMYISYSGTYTKPKQKSSFDRYYLSFD